MTQQTHSDKFLEFQAKQDAKARLDFLARVIVSFCQDAHTERMMRLEVQNEWQRHRNDCRLRMARELEALLGTDHPGEAVRVVEQLREHLRVAEGRVRELEYQSEYESGYRAEISRNADRWQVEAEELRERLAAAEQRAEQAEALIDVTQYTCECSPDEACAFARQRDSYYALANTLVRVVWAQSKQIAELKKKGTLQSVIDNIKKYSEPPDPEIAQAVNDSFWEMYGPVDQETDK